VKVLGFTSANGRIYDFAAVKEAIQKYEKAPVNKDHNMEEPSFSDRLGWLENVTLQKDGLYADFHYNPHAEGIESFLWFAEHNGLGDVGFSHLVSGKYSVDPDGTERITRIDKVKSVDLVANPATTKTIFESEVKPMANKVIEEATQDVGTGDSVQYRGGFGTIKNIKKFDKGTIYSIRNSRGSEDTLKIYDDENKNTHADWILKVKKIPNRKEKSPADQGYDQRSAYNESDEPVVFGSTVTKTFYDKMKKLAASGSEEGKRQVAWIEDEIKKSEKERKIQKDLWAKHLKDKKSKSEQEGKPMDKKIAKEAGNAANKAKKNELDRKQGEDFMKRNSSLFKPTPGFPNQLPADYDYKPAQKAFGRSFKKGTSKDVGEDDSVDEAYKDQPSDPYELGVFLRKQGVKKPDNPFGDGIGKTWNSDQFDRGFSGRPRAIFKTKPGDPGEQEGDDEMDNKKMMEEENPMQQEEAMQEPMMEEADDVYAKVKEVCEGEGSDEEKSQKILEMLGLSGGMSEGEGEPMEEAEEDPKEKVGSESAVLEVDDEEEEEPKKESKSELASLRKWKAEKLKEEKIVNLIKESNLEPTKVFIKQLSAIDSKLWSEAINDRKKVALVKSSVKPISSGLQSRSESSYKQFLESVLGK
jgi:hypothetical protein